MSAIPSLSVWSSLKIPLTEYYKSPVPYVGSWKPIKQKSNSETTREVVNLRVPSPFRKATENSLSEIICACQDVQKQRDFCKKPGKNISCLCVPVPDIPTSKRGFMGKSTTNHCHRLTYEDSYNDDLRLNWDENLTDSDTEMEFDYIPSVKPWTSEELCALNKRYHLVEDKAKMATDKKKKHKRRVKITKSEQTTPAKTHRISDWGFYKSRKSLSQNFSQKDSVDGEYLTGSNDSFSFDLSGNSDDSIASYRENSFSPAKPTGRNYYETKLAELYMIELGIKR